MQPNILIISLRVEYRCYQTHPCFAADKNYSCTHYFDFYFFFQKRSAVIATYACCGFGSISAIGTYVGALSAVAPERRGDISEIAFRAAVNGNIAGFLTACIAGGSCKTGLTYSYFFSHE